MRFSDIDFNVVQEYLVCTSDEDIAEISIYINAAKSYMKTYTGLTEEELDENEYFVMPTLMLISSFYENKSVEMDSKISAIYTNLLNLGKVHSL